jgi:predicted transcriptional regulator
MAHNTNKLRLEDYSGIITVKYDRYWKDTSIETVLYFLLEKGEFKRKLSYDAGQTSLIFTHRENMMGMMWDSCYLSYKGHQQSHELWEQMEEKFQAFIYDEFHNS